MAIDVIRSKIVIAGLSYIQPVFRANYTQIRVTAEVTFPDFLGVEILTPTDLVSLTAVKNVSDAIEPPQDYFLKSFGKGLFEQLTPSDVISTQLVFIRNFLEFLASPDAISLTNSLSKTDSFSILDNDVISFNKNVSDSISMLDNMDGEIDFLFFKVLNDPVVVNELQIFDFNAQKADNITANSSGVLSMQDYCDITYFLEDYVGLSRSFT